MAGKLQKLNEKQKRFAKEYLIDLNATQAAIRAGYAPKAAGQQAFKLLKNTQIQDYIQRNNAKTAEKLDLSRERILAEYAKLGFSDMADYGGWDENGNATLRASKDLGHKTAAIREMEVTELPTPDGGVKRLTKLKLHAKREALDSICKLMGYTVNKHEISGPGGSAIPIAFDLSALTDDELAQLEALSQKVHPVVPEPAAQEADAEDDDE